MKEYAVESSNIKKIAYDTDQRILVVTFSSDASYAYENVDPETVCNLLFSDSIGKTFAVIIKKKFDCKKLTSPRPKTGDEKHLYVVGQVMKEIDENNYVWDLHGVFSSEKEAVKECITDQYFVGPVIVDKAFPHERVVWPDAYYPMADKV